MEAVRWWEGASSRFESVTPSSRLSLSLVISHTVRRPLGRTPAPAPASSSCSRGNRNERILMESTNVLLFFWCCHFNNLNVYESLCV